MYSTQPAPDCEQEGSKTRKRDDVSVSVSADYTDVAVDYDIVGNINQPFCEEISSVSDPEASVHPDSDSVATALENLEDLARTYRLEDMPIDQFQKILNGLPPNHSDRPAVMNLIGAAYQAQFMATQDVDKLSKAVSILQGALALCPKGHSDRLQCLQNLAAVLLTRFQISGSDQDLDDTIDFSGEAEQLCTENDEGHAQALYGLANALYFAFSKSGRDKDLDEVIHSYTGVTQIVTEEDPRYVWSYHNLAVSYYSRFQRSHDLPDLDSCIRCNEVALRLRPRGHPDHVISLAKLAEASLARHRISMEQADLERGVTLYEAQLDLCPYGHSDHLSALMDLSHALFTRFELHARMDDIRRAVQLRKQMLHQCPQGHPLHAPVADMVAKAVMTLAEQSGLSHDLNDGIALAQELLRLGFPDQASSYERLAKALLIRFEHIGEIAELKPVITANERALALRPPGDTARPSSLISLANSLAIRWTRGEASDGLQNKDLNDSMKFYREALKLCPDQHPNHGSGLQGLARLLYGRYQRFKNINDLKEAIELQQFVLQSRQDGHPQRTLSLRLYAAMLDARFELSGAAADIEKSVEILEKIVESLPAGRRDNFRYQISLAHAYMSRFRHSSSITDLQLAVTTYEKVLGLYPEGLWDQGMLLYNAATAICTRADHLGDLNDLQKGIKLYRDALDFINETHIFYSSFATSLATSLVDRFIRQGDVDDLKECINLHEKALHYRPKGNPDRLRSLVNLAGALHIRFKLGGSLDDEEDSIRLYREALDLCLEGHADRAWALNNLATALKVRFEQFEDTTDLNEVITLGEEALALYHKGRVGRSLALYNVASAFHTRYDRLGDANDGERSVQLLLEAFDTMSESSPYRAYTLKSLSAILLLQYQRSGNVNALKRAIDECHRALELLPEGHPERPQHLHQLANLIAARGQQAGAMGDMEKAIKLTVDSIEGLPAGHPDGSLHRQSLAWFYLHNFNMSTDTIQLELAFEALSAAVNDVGRIPRLRLNNAVDWLAAIENIKSLDSYLNPSGRESLVEDYQQTIHLLPQVAYFGLDIGSRLRVLKLSERLANDGAAHALLIEKPQTAIEMLEEGRAVFWTQALRLRTLFDKLPSQISDELRSLSRQLELDSYRRAVAAPEAINVARFLEDDTARRRRLSVKFESKIKEARAVPGFGRFLLNEEFSYLAQVSERGPVVVLLAGKSSCQAIAIQRDKTTERIALPSVTVQKLEKLSFMLKGIIVKLRDLDYDDFDEPSERKGSQGTGSGGVFLGYLWQKIVKPVIHAMGIPRSQGRNRPRLWWCPTGPFSFLPLHAAGTYRDLQDSVADDIKGEFDDEFECCADYVVSSYTPTLQALINARRELDPIPRTGAKVLLVAEPGVPGTVSYLNKASEEVEIVARVAGAKAILRLDGDGHDQPQSGPTVQMVVDKLPAATVVHLSCHGQQHLADPLESGFVLRDRKKLTVARLMQLRLTRALLAFLAACETARGDRAQPDQTVHLAATMFFTGFKSIIGTMWSMWDKDGPFVADVVYRELFKDGLLAPDDIPYALDSAARQLRAKGVPAEQWATYIHIGV